ncbi:hypothetical protein LTR78_006885 [Recurvomyces mirabilis]|uniref:BTB domain-containing protein n=1 Tax=Recurvomyces mirabilis TaxID=574656 RepID=A0AAE0WKE5_9PEZI|nr:hypothetical protein LTR78_006885 [Recurvomyces mirabilis]KAK5153124.1 hypothetical protein LTS14_007768 [Recurvomyces mirabilis]
MVSHHHLPSSYDLPSPAPSAPPAFAPRAASVTSGRSHTRRHRHARTHHGGSVSSTSSYAPQNEFPIFSNTGDVEITITSANGRKEQRYVLHRLILSQCSGFFEAGTRAEWSGAGQQGLARIREDGESVTAGGSSSRPSSQDRSRALPDFQQQPKQRWKYALDWKNAADGEAPMLVQVSDTPSLFGGTTSSSSRIRPPPPSNENFFRSMTNFSALNLNERSQVSVPTEAGDEVLKDYDNLFRTMYQYPPILDSINIATAYTECKALLHLADIYDALEIVGSRVDHHLLRFGARLFKQIAKYPPSYLKLGYLARSRTIFIEALIHVVGQWPLGAPQLRGGIDNSVMELIEDKVDELLEQQERVEFKLWRLSPITSRGERVTPEKDFLGWLAVSLFRSWLAENTTPAPASGAKDGERQRPGSEMTAGGGAGVGRSSSRSSAHIASQRTQPPPPPTPPSIGKIFRIIGAPSTSSSTTTTTSGVSASSSTPAYLTHDDLKRFLKLQPDLYTRDNLRRFERKMDEIKSLAREAVKPLMRNFLELDLGTFGAGGLGYLTCIRLEEGEVPWD